MQTGWFKEVHVKDIDSHSVRALLASRALLVKIKRDLENHVRGLLKNLGLVIGRAKFNVFAVRAEELIQGRPTPANYYLRDRLYDGILFVGQHAMAGAKNGVLAHSQSFSVERISLNGRSVGEIGQVAAIAGYFHIPVIMLAGDQAACDELLELQPKAETVAVKRGVGKASALSLSHEEARAYAELMLEELRNHVAEVIGPIAKPANILFTPELPKTRSGKIMRRLLRDVAENRPLGDTTTLADPAVVEEIKDRASVDAGAEE
jgi:acyl-CoA synthetase (AMP-forming)/AMP-acid ligase II